MIKYNEKDGFHHFIKLTVHLIMQFSQEGGFEYLTHSDYRNRGYASALLEKASEIAKEFKCYKIFLETGSNKKSTLNFYRNNGFAIDEKHSCLKKL